MCLYKNGRLLLQAGLIKRYTVHSKKSTSPCLPESPKAKGRTEWVRILPGGGITFFFSHSHTRQRHLVPYSKPLHLTHTVWRTKGRIWYIFPAILPDQAQYHCSPMWLLGGDPTRCQQAGGQPPQTRSPPPEGQTEYGRKLHAVLGKPSRWPLSEQRVAVFPPAAGSCSRA